MPPAKLPDARSRNIVINIIKYCDEEKKRKGFIVPLNKPTERAASICGKSVKTIKRLRRELNLPTEIESSYSNCIRKTRKICINERDIYTIRHTIRQFYTKYKQTPTLKHLMPALINKVNVKRTRGNLIRILNEMGFHYRKHVNKGRLLLERSCLITERVNYLNQKKCYKDCNIVYIGENTLTYNSGKQQLTCVTAFNNDGPIQGCTHISKSTIKSDFYIKWLKDNLLCKLVDSSVVVIDSSICIKTQYNIPPTIFNNINTIREWMTEHGYIVDRSLTKVELLECIERSDELPQYGVVDLFNAHTVLVLPSHHLDINPVGLMWTKISDLMVAENITGDVPVEQYMLNSVTGFDKTDWSMMCNNVQTAEEQYLKDDYQIDMFTD